MGSQDLTSASLSIVRGKKKKGKEVRTKEPEEMSRPSHQAPIHRGSPGLRLMAAGKTAKGTSVFWINVGSHFAGKRASDQEDFLSMMQKR